jgi:hypothetical protein
VSSSEARHGLPSPWQLAWSLASPNHTRSPGTAPGGGAMGSTTVFSGSFDAARSMPADLMPRMLRGLRLQTKTQRRPWGW